MPNRLPRNNGHQHPSHPAPPSINVNWEDTTPVECPTCGHRVFIQGVIYRRIPALISGLPNDQNAAIPVPICVACDQPHLGFLPPEIRDDYPVEEPPEF